MLFDCCWPKAVRNIQQRLDRKGRFRPKAFQGVLRRYANE